MNGAHWSRVVAVAAMLNILNPADAAQAQQPPVSISWRLIANRPDNRFEAELTLINSGDAALGNKWALYFNSASRIYPESVAKDFALTHINGDFFVLRPSPDAPPIAAGESRTIRYEGGPWALNRSDAPSGFYLVARRCGRRACTDSDFAANRGISRS